MKCSDCKSALSAPPPIGGTGCALLPDGKQICYTCADKRQVAELKDRSRPFVAYRTAPIRKNQNTMKTCTDTTARVYVGTYAKYNVGSLKGGWVDLEDYSDRDAFLEACAALHSDESDPELMFQDFEGFPRCWYCESSAPPDIVWEWLDLSDHEREAFALYADHVGGDATVEDFRGAYCGHWKSGGEYAEEMAGDHCYIPKNFPDWIVIDWDASWECNLRHDYFSEDGSEGVHIFHNC